VLHCSVNKLIVILRCISVVFLFLNGAVNNSENGRLRPYLAVFLKLAAVRQSVMTETSCIRWVATSHDFKQLPV